MTTVFKRYGVELWAGEPHYRHNDGGMFARLDYSYELYADGVLIASGDNFSPAAYHAIGDYQSVCDLLGFLTLRPGDTDDKFFSNHTPQHLEWLETIQAEDVRAWICSIEDRS